MSLELLEKEILNVDDIYSLILEHILEDEKDFIRLQYEKAKEAKIDSSIVSKESFSDELTTDESDELIDDIPFEHEEEDINGTN
jgi:hypothetical protein